jgi:hypothetical protein
MKKHFKIVKRDVIGRISNRHDQIQAIACEREKPIRSRIAYGHAR